MAGNVVEDKGPAGEWIPGGPSLYSARTALSLGATVTLVSNIPPGYDRSVLEGLRVVATGEAPAPRYINIYDEEGQRTQKLLEEGPVLEVRPEMLPVEPVDGLIIAPAFHELAVWPPVPARVTGVSLQGLLRARDEQNRVFWHPEPVKQVAPTVKKGSFAFFSEEDTAQPVALARMLCSEDMTVLLTRGLHGALLFEPGGRETTLDSIQADVVEPTGAGDCFATAFIVAFAETGDLQSACRFALAAGSLAVEGVGLAGIPDRAAVTARLRKAAA